LLEQHAPEVVVAQLGADALAGDPVGQHFNLTERSFVHVVQQLKSTFARVLILGGGGYQHANTAVAWSWATAAALGLESQLPVEIPEQTARFEEFGPDFRLCVRPTTARDENVGVKQ